MCDLLGRGTVITIDIAESSDRPEHGRVNYLLGSSTDTRLVERVQGLIPPEAAVMVILDSDHAKEHVLRELQLYGELVTPGNYLVVEDTNVNGHPVRPDFGPGPMEAIEDFLAATDRFDVDSDREKFFMTFNPAGYLRCVR
jgi:cephalosporin hydroxylase